MKPSLKRITAVLPVQAIEASLPFWEAVGLGRTVEVPHGGALGGATEIGYREPGGHLVTFAQFSDDGQ